MQIEGVGDKESEHAASAADDTGTAKDKLGTVGEETHDACRGYEETERKERTHRLQGRDESQNNESIDGVADGARG